MTIVITRSTYCPQYLYDYCHRGRCCRIAAPPENLTVIKAGSELMSFSAADRLRQVLLQSGNAKDLESPYKFRRLVGQVFAGPVMYTGHHSVGDPDSQVWLTPYLGFALCRPMRLPLSVSAFHHRGSVDRGYTELTHSSQRIRSPWI